MERKSLNLINLINTFDNNLGPKLKHKKSEFRKTFFQEFDFTKYKKYIEQKDYNHILEKYSENNLKHPGKYLFN